MIQQRCLSGVRGLTTCFSTLACAALVASAFTKVSEASVSYTSAGSLITQNFDLLPNTPTNASLGTSPLGWIDDTVSPGAGNFSLPGWYLYHSATIASDGGNNNHQRMRAGSGNSGTGGFMSFGVNASTDRALGAVGSANTGSLNYGLRLTNNSSITLNDFTLSYTAEQWRDGGAASPAAQSVTFDYKVTSGAATIHDTGFSANVASLGFSTPVFTNTGSGAALVGNLAANQVAVSATVTGINWAPGTDLWLRWTDIDDGGSNLNDHGMGIDDLTFSAVAGAPPSNEINSVATGLASAGTTWSDGLAPSAGKNYHILTGHVVTLDGAFAGDVLNVQTGTLNMAAGASGASVPSITVDSTSNGITTPASGNFSLGADATNLLLMNRNQNFTIPNGSEFHLKSSVTGSGNIDFAGSAGSQLWLDATNGHTGIIRFNGGDKVHIEESASVGNLEMNSATPGGNVLTYDAKVSATGGTVTFNAAGTIEHAAGTVATQRLQGPTLLNANAQVTMDLTHFFPNDGAPTEERRLLLTNGVRGAGNLVVNGTATDAPGGAITLNEFEIGQQGTEPPLAADNYSGTITANNYVNVEIRRNMPGAKIVVNSNARVETGWAAIASNAGTTLGEVNVKNGGTFEVGFEQGDASTTGHQANQLLLDKDSGRTGSLTLEAGSTLRMQVNGTAANAFDSITAEGTVALNGALNVLVNPSSCLTATCGTNSNPIYTPVIGDTFDIINTSGGFAPGDYNQDGSVNSGDYSAWRSAFGTTVTAGTGADGNGNGVVDAADFVFWRNNVGATAAGITGTFSNILIDDPSNYLASNGAALQVIYSASKVQLKVVALGSGSGASFVAAVPEPSALYLACSLAMCFAAKRSTRSNRQRA